jgi:tRNA(fMet)-specific endonuclease VapC
VYLLDTNTIGDLVRNPEGKAAQRLAATGEELIATSIVVRCEIEFGLELKSSQKLRKRTGAILKEIAVLGLDTPAHEFYGAIRAKLKQLGTPIGPNDLFIAAHALALNATLVTGNEKEFSRVPGLKIENWLR